MSRRKEIKEKEELQARFQYAVSQSNSLVLDWLKPVEASHNTQSASTDSIHDSFYNLPIIPNGGSLSSLKDDDNTLSIGEFMKSNDKEFKNLKKDSDANRVTSKPMLALMNKTRDSTREKIKQKHNNNNNNNNNFRDRRQPNYTNNRSNVASGKKVEEDSDSDDDKILQSRSVKKGSNMLLESKLNGKNKKKGGRPF
ncbi:hypothetical protein DFJ63DRAFT_319355 [Scheffersomyces coipomensis]|uniref:uncharacterized protein n=1 Tax=Scheffersomyces coipomensis TaxID=1788519 RepID=UPI00315C71A8